MIIRTDECHRTSLLGLNLQGYKLPRSPDFEGIGPSEDRSPPQANTDQRTISFDNVSG